MEQKYLGFNPKDNVGMISWSSAGTSMGSVKPLNEQQDQRLSGGGAVYGAPQFHARSRADLIDKTRFGSGPFLRLSEPQQFAIGSRDDGADRQRSRFSNGGPVQDVQSHGFTPKAYADGGAVVSFGDLAPANFAGRMQVSGPGMKEYNEKYAFGPGTGRTTAPRNFMNERYESPQKKPASTRRKLADGGPVQDVQAKGFVPVKVSNGEFEFTPEQVANIGAAMLASKG